LLEPIAHLRLPGTDTRPEAAGGLAELFQPVLVGEPQHLVWDKKDGGGRIVLTGCTTTFSDSLCDFDSLDDNAIFTLNAVAFLLEGRPYQLLGPGASLMSSSLYAFDGSLFDDYRAALNDVDLFSSRGIHSRAVSATSVNLITPLVASQWDGFLAPYWSDSDVSPYELDTLIEFFLGGGDLFLCQDDFLHDAIGEALGVPTSPATDYSPTNGLFPLYQGSFGTAFDVLSYGAVGQLDEDDIRATNGIPAGFNDSWEITAAWWPPGRYAPGSGALLIITDVDAISFKADYDAMDTNARCGLNAVAGLARPDGDSIRRYGNARAGSGQWMPSLKLLGTPLIGNSIDVTVFRGLGGAICGLFAGWSGRLAAGPDDGLLVKPPLITDLMLLGGAAGVAGAGGTTLRLPILDDWRLVGLTIDLQVLVADPVAPSRLAMSDALEFVIGQ